MSINEEVRRAIRDAIEANGGLLGKKEIGKRLRVSRQRAGQLAESPDFPTPIADVSGVPVWLGADVDAWRARRYERLKKRQQRGTRSDRHATLRGAAR